MKSLRTKRETKYQQWLLHTIYPSFSDEALENLREDLIVCSERDNVNYFNDGKMIANVVGDIKINQQIKCEIPESVSVAIDKYVRDNPNKVAPTLVSVGYGLGDLEWTLLKKGKVSKVLGLEFTTSMGDKMELRHYINEHIEKYSKYNQFLSIFYDRKDSSIKSLFLDGLRDYIDAFNIDASMSMFEDVIDSLYKMINPEYEIESDYELFNLIINTYKIKMNALAGSSREHRQFKKKIIDTGKKSFTTICEIIAGYTKRAHIVLFNNSLHHSKSPYLYLQSAFEALREKRYMVVIEPFIFNNCSSESSLIKTVFETTLHPESLLTLREHERWINLFLLSGATIESKIMHSGIKSFPINYDPYHRFEICLRKQKSVFDKLPSLNIDEFEENKVEEAEKLLNYDLSNGKYSLQGLLNCKSLQSSSLANDRTALIHNKTLLSHIINKYSLPELEYIELIDAAINTRIEQRRKSVLENNIEILLEGEKHAQEEIERTYLETVIHPRSWREMVHFSGLEYKIRCKYERKIKLAEKYVKREIDRVFCEINAYSNDRLRLIEPKLRFTMEMIEKLEVKYSNPRNDLIKELSDASFLIRVYLNYLFPTSQ